MDAGARVTQEQLPRSCSAGAANEGPNTGTERRPAHLQIEAPESLDSIWATEPVPDF